MPNPACTINGSAPPVDVAASSTVNGALVSTAGAQYWSIACTSTDETNTAAAINATLVVNQASKTFSFTAPSAGSAVIFTSTVGINGPGLDANSALQASYTTTFKVNVTTVGGQRVMAYGETSEQSSSFGWVSIPNQAARNAGGSGTGNQGQFNISLSNGLNSNLSTTGLSLLRVGGPTAAFSIDGIATTAGSKAGLPITIVNTTAYPCTLLEEGSGSTAPNRLSFNRIAPSGSTVTGPVILGPLGGSATLQYDTTAQRWALISAGWHYRKEIDVREFGAVIDGSTDDTAQIQAAADSIPVSGGTSRMDLFLPLSPTTSTQSGDTRCWARITKPISLNNAANGCTRFYGAGRSKVGLSMAIADCTAPHIVSGNVSPGATYVHYTTGGADIWGVSTTYTPPYPYINLSQWDVGDVGNVASTGFAFLIQYNPLSYGAPASTECFAESYGTLNGAVFNSFRLLRVPQGGGVTWIIATIVLNWNGTTQTFTATSTTDLTANYMNLIEVRFCATNQTFSIALNGTIQQSVATNPSSINSTSVAQSYFEEFMVGVGGFVSYPSSGGGRYNGPQGVIGPFGVWTNTVAPANFTYNPATYVMTTPGYGPFPTIFVDWRPANQGATYRTSLSDYVIGYGTTNGRNTFPGSPVWLQTNASGGETYVAHSDISEMGLAGAGGGVLHWASLASKTHDLMIIGSERGISFDNYSYNNEVRNVDFVSNRGGRFVSANIITLNGSQFTKLGAGITSSFSSSSWHVIHTFGTLSLDSGFPNGFSQGIYLFAGGAGATTFSNVAYTDENAGFAVAGTLIAPRPSSGLANFSLSWFGGSIYHIDSTCPHFILGAGCGDIDIHADIGPSSAALNAPLFSFQASAGPQPVVRWGGVSSTGDGAPVVVDPSHPGLVDIPTKITVQFSLSQAVSATNGSGNIGTPTVPADWRPNVGIGSIFQLDSTGATNYTITAVASGGITFTPNFGGTTGATTLRFTKVIIPPNNGFWKEYVYTGTWNADCTIVFPFLVSGYAPRWVNANGAAHNLLIGGPTGSTVTLAQGKICAAGPDPTGTNFVFKTAAV